MMDYLEIHSMYQDKYEISNVKTTKVTFQINFNSTLVWFVKVLVFCFLTCLHLVISCRQHCEDLQSQLPIITSFVEQDHIWNIAKRLEQEGGSKHHMLWIGLYTLENGVILTFLDTYLVEESSVIVTH